MDIAPLTSALAALRAAAQRLLTRLAERPALAPEQAALPRALANNPLAAERRIARSLHWLAAIGSLLAGERTYHRPVAYVPPSHLAEFFAVPPRAPGARPEVTQASREKSRAASRLAYLRHALATVPTAELATRLARRLGLTASDAAWPHALIAIAEPPAIWAARAYPRHAEPNPVRQANALLRAARAVIKAANAARRLPPLPHPRE